MGYDQVERVLGKALEKLLNRQKVPQCDLDTWNSLVCDQRRGDREGSLRHYVPEVSLVATALTAELQAEGKFWMERAFNHLQFNLKKKNQSPWLPSTYLDPPHES